MGAHNLLRGIAAVLASASLAAMAAPPLVKPFAGAIPKAEKRGFKSEPHRVQFEIDALLDLVPGDEIDFTSPKGKLHKFVFDRVEDAGNGIRTIYAHARGHKGTYDAVITQGPDAVFGRVATPDGEYSFSPAQGYQFLLDMDVEKPYDNVLTHGNDAFTLPKDAPTASAAKAVTAPPVPAAATAWTSCSMGSPCTVDLMVLWSPALRTSMGSASAVQTRIANMVANTNTAYVNSQVAIQLRLVNAQEIPYVELSEPDGALYEFSPLTFTGEYNARGYAANVETLRNQYGADMVNILVDGPQFSGAGVAWVPNPGTLAATASNRNIMYSSISGCWGFDCSYVFAHELGHNMGNQHDRPTSTFDGNGTITEGSYSYSYGHYRCKTGGVTTSAPANCLVVDKSANFADIMAYFHASTTRVMKFSNPNLSCSGTNTGDPAACGVAEGFSNSADAARTINLNAVALANMKDTVVGPALASSGTSVTSSLNPSNQGQGVNFTATVSGSSGVPTGTVNFRDNGVSISGCSAVPLSAGVASCATAALAGGSRSISAVYSGSGTYSGSTGGLTQVVRITPTVTLSTSANNVAPGTLVTFSANVSSGAAGGTVAFTANGAAIGGCGGVVLGAGGLAQCMTSALASGTHSIAATYSGAAAFNGAASSPISEVVLFPTSVAPSAATSKAMFGNQVVISATVSGGGSPTGTMTVFQGSTPMAGCINVALVGGSATCALTETSGAGIHNYAVQYNGSNTHLASVGVVSVEWRVRPRLRVDFNNDGRADILWLSTTGRTAEWLMSGGTQIGGRELFGAGTGWAPILTGDFNGDGFTDILFEHADGGSAMWLMNGDTQIGGARLLVAGTGWKAKLVADFNGDGKADIVWEHTDGRVAMWLMNGTAQVGGGVILVGGTNYHVKFAADFNNDGRADILWEHVDQSSALWLMDGMTQIGGGRLFAGGSGWLSVATADLNADGMADIVWRHADGRVATWLMNGSSQVGGAVIMGAGSAYTPIATGDVNGDGKADIVYQHVDGSAYVQLMNGATNAAGTVPMFSAGTWSLKRFGDFNGDGNADWVAVQLSDGAVNMGVYNGTNFTPSTLLGAGTGYVPIGVLD